MPFALDLVMRLALGLSTLWGSLALLYRLPVSRPGRRLAALAWLLAGTGLLWLYWQGTRAVPAAGMATAMLALLAWWRRIRPARDLDWADDVAHQATGRRLGDRLVLDRVRCFDWQTRDRARIAWEAREYDLSRLASLDLFVSRWGRPGIAHVLLSFGFADARGGIGEFVAFSVEVRRERHEPFSELGGFFKRFELAIIAADERDLVRLRSNVRGESVTLYRVLLGKRERLALLLALVEEANRLEREPRFYHTITANCTTQVFALMRRIIGGLPVDHRLLLTGLLPSYVRDHGGLVPGHSLVELRRLGDITERARRADGDPDFSRRIREGVPGWGRA
ncbi:Lnb N-terminal periplasmic domain-containing protein [Halomonas ramblicola]|uniref:Lnb N-terminal periplasmic domain-containing protein n=1 Tax=Halomonas ramblicola TaxID=747349 RepID=UPI0025B3C69B|nr:DUF4105 domain-containing protein [Halomonas ramblicola]MDN3521085.1 DUF4105 domain-containing protein [Halomonas ramblicola]